MPVDPLKPREVLVVHGVQTGSDSELKQHEWVRELIERHLNGIPLRFTTSLYPYEGLNDAARGKLDALLGAIGKALLAGVPLSGMIIEGVGAVVDLIEDVVLALESGSTAQQIRAGLRDRILATYLTSGAPLYLVAHSLGSVYAFDVINELIRTRPHDVFDRARRKTWPVQGLATIGSPLGLDMFSGGRSLAPLGQGQKWLRWFNFWCRTDPVISGSFYGKPLEGYRIAERYLRQGNESGWVVQDRVLDSGQAWLPAHTSYWKHAPFGDDLVTFLTS